MQTDIQIIAVPAFKDNYIWVIHNRRYAVAIDPGDAAPLQHALAAANLELQAILITHHHQDHIGGVQKLLATNPEIAVFAPKLESYDFKHRKVSEPDSIQCTAWLPEIKIIDLPGHTLGHVAYLISINQEDWLFCGDTLFGAGCGRLFEGTPEQMLTSLQKLAALPAQTRMFCTHEYTLHNINFALTLEPGNADLQQRKIEVLATRAKNLPTLPSSIKMELATNPFLRCHSEEIKHHLNMKSANDLEIFTRIRELRNNY